MPSEQIGASCNACDWTLTIDDVLSRLEDSNVSLAPTPQRVRNKLGSYAEGHAYFNRGHRVKTHLSTEDISEVLDDAE